MEYIYAALLLHAAGQPITEENLKRVIEAANLTPDEAKIKTLVSALEGVDIGEVLKNVTLAPTAPAAPAAAQPAAEEAAPAKEEEKKEEEKKEEEEALSGLAALFG